MKAKTKLIIGIVLAVVILAVGLTVTLVVTGNLERDQQQVVRSASQIETAMSTDLGGKTIVLAEDITVEGDLEMSRLADLDLNGHTLTVTGTFSVESDSAAEIEIKSTDGDKAVSGGTIDAGSVDINVPKAHVEWSADVRLGSDGTFTVLTSGDSFIFTGRFLSSGTAAASEPTITALGGRVDISSQTANVEYKVNIPSTASDVRVDSGVPSTSSVEVITSKSVTVSGTVAVTVSEGATGVAITADSGSSLTVTGSAASVNAPSSSVTVAENSTVGSLTAGDVTNNGTVSGSITASGDVTNVGSVGSVNASGNVTNTGTVSGDVTAGGTLDNGNGATIGGDVSAGTVTGDTSGIGGDVEITDITEIAVPELSATSFVYDGQVKTVSVAENAAYTVTGDTSATNAGSYTVTVTLNDPVNTKWADDYANAARTFAWTIEKATVSGITFEDATIPYDGNAHSLQIGGTLPSGVTVSYSANSHTAVGTYTVTASFDVGSNYNAIPDMTATLTITRGTIDVGTAEELTDALSDSGYSTIRLTADIEYTNLAAFNTAVQAANGSLTIDLNDNTLTLTANGTTITAQNGFELTIANGELIANNSTYTKACFSAETDSTITFEDLLVTSTGSVLLPRGDAAEINIIDSNIETTGVYVVGTNAATEDNYGVEINIDHSTLTTKADDGDSCVVMINVAGTLNIKDTDIIGQRQGVIVRAGTATLDNVYIEVDLKYTAGTAHDSNPSGWLSGNEVAYGALIVGNNTKSTYNADAIVKMTGGGITCTTSVSALKGHTNAIYAVRVGGSNNTTSVTLSGTKVSGQVVNYNNTATITGLPSGTTVITALVSSADEFENALAVNDSYIVLVDDINVGVSGSTNHSVIISGISVTIDFNGHTITNVGAQIAFYVTGSDTVVNLYDNGDGAGGIYGGSGGNNMALRVDAGATVNIYGGNYSVGPDASNLGNSCLECGSNAGNGNLNIYGGRFSTEAAYNGWYYVLNLVQTQGADGTITVYGGEFVNYNPALGDDNLGGNFVADGYKVVERTDGTYEVVAEEAEVTGDDIVAVYYYDNGVASKAEVYAASGLTNAIGGGYSDIVLMADFSLGETVTVEADDSVTLDFNGKSVTYTGTAGLRPIQNYGTLTVLNTEDNLTEEGQGGMECIYETVYGVFDCLAGSTTYIYGGYYETNGSDSAAVLRIREGAEATVYDGSFVCSGYDAAVSSDGKLTIYDGYYYTDSSNRGNFNYCVKSGGEFYMYGGTVIGVQGGIAIFGGSGKIYDCDVTVRDNVHEADPSETDRSFYALYVAGEVTEVTCLVEGGTFNAHYRYAAYIGNSNAGGDGGLMLDARIQINGGTFIGEMGAIHVDGTLGTAIIRGGSFNTDVNEYVADGKVCVQNTETEMYDVVLSDYVIETAQDFLDLQQFNSAILAGKSLNVTLANDIDLNNIDMSDAYSSDILVSHFAGTFNGNGHTIKSNGVPYIFGFALNSAEFKNVTIEFNDTEITRLVYRSEYTAIGRSGNTFYVEDDSELVLTYDNVDYAPSSTNEEYYYDFGSVGNSALYYNNNCTLAYAYYDGSDIDTYADSAYYNTDRTTVLPFKITIKNCDVSANFRGAEHGSGAAIFLGGQIYGTYVDIDTCSYSGDFVGEYAGIIFANASGVSGFLDGDGDWNGSFVTGGITYTSNISISDVSLTGTLSTLNGGFTFGNNVTEGVGSSTAESGELTNMTADSSLGISQNESGNYVITGASTDDGTYSYSLRLMMGTVNWYYDADYTNYYGETSNFTITIALDIDETPIELGYSKATPLALSQAIDKEIVASDFSEWDGTSEEGYRYAFVESGDSHYVIIDFQGQYGDAYRQFDSDSGTTTAKIYAFDSLDRFVATATEV